MKRWALAAMLLVQCSKPEHASPGAQPASLASAASTAASASASGAEAPSGVASAASPPPVAPKTDSPGRHARALHGVAQLQGVIRRRVARGRETEEVCLERNHPENSGIETALDEVDEDPMTSKPTTSSKPEDLAPSVIDSLVGDCMDCTGANGVPRECKQALVALDKLAVELRAAK